MSRTLHIELPAGTPLISANDRLNHYARAKLTKGIKAETARILADLDPEPFPGKVRIIAVYHPSTRHRHDPGNIYPSAKAAIDALVPSVLPDDSSKYISSLEMIVSDEIVKGGKLTIDVIPEDSPEFRDRFTVIPDECYVQLACFRCPGPGDTFDVGYHPSLDVVIGQARAHNRAEHDGG